MKTLEELLKELKEKLALIPDWKKKMFPQIFAIIEQMIFEIEDEDGISRHTKKNLIEQLQKMLDGLD